jgi:hypothetical protein
MSLLYLLLNIAVVVLCVALVYWALRVFNIPLDPWVLKIAQFIVALIVIILIVSWFAGVLPPRGVFGGMRNLGEYAFLPLLRRFA